MVTIPIQTTLSDEEAGLELQAILTRLDDRRGFYTSVGERLLSSSKDRFRAQTAPDGAPWTPLKSRTIKARERKGQTPITILRSNSRGKAGSSLAGSLSYDASADQVTVSSTLPYAAIHQFGGTINIPERKGKIFRKTDALGKVGRRFVKKEDADTVTETTIPAHSIRMPARPFVGLTAADEEGILEDARNWLSR